MAAVNFDGPVLSHPALPGGEMHDFAYPDLEIFAKYGLIHSKYLPGGTMDFVISPDGFDHYEKIQRAKGAGVARIESEVRSFLDADGFLARFPAALAKWSQAEARLWGANADQQLTTIGHECREAVQLFGAAFALLAGCTPSANPASTIDNARSGLNALKSRLPKTVYPMLDALLVYWGTVDDLVQRQEHGASKEGAPIGWIDARRVVFQTAMTMYELSHALDLVNTNS